jgi:uncharacterized protein (TIGR02588 family)
MSPEKSSSSKTPARKPSRSRSTASRAKSGSSSASTRSSSGSRAKSSTTSAASKASESTKSSAVALKRERTPFEWILLLVALGSIGTIVVGLFLYAGHKAGGEAELVAEATDTGKPVDGAPQVELTVRNVGGSGAEEVLTEVTMGEESREVTMVRIPKDDEATAIVSFPAGTTGTPEAEILSYNQP